MRGHRKALVINASPHHSSVVERFCTTFEQSFGIRYRVRLNLCRETPPPGYSDGTYEHDSTRYQHLVRTSDVLFIGTPTYWFNIPAILKAFLDELAAIDETVCERERFATVAGSR